LTKQTINQMTNNIYYLLDFYKKCSIIINYDEKTINNYCKYVQSLLDTYFNINEQKQLRLYNFNHDLMYKFVYQEIDDILFDNLDELKLHDFFDKISVVDIKNFHPR
jgi:hypothetical protein